MKTKRVVITGVGAVCAFGREWREIEAAFRAGNPFFQWIYLFG